MNLLDNEIIYASPEISAGSVKWLWHSNYWDGPLNGMVKIKDNEYWVEYFDETTSHVVEPLRKYAVFKLTPEQQESEEFWHELFRVCVGHHSTYDDNGRRYSFASSGTKFSMSFFYGRHRKDKKELDFSKAELIGWFK